MPQTKIIATIGPASDNKTILRKMMLAGLDVARLNFSHGKQQDHRRSIELIRQLNKKYRRHIRILQDLEGYRIRIGRFKNKKEIVLSKRQIIHFTNQETLGEGNLIPFDYTGQLQGFKPGMEIFIDDGNILLRVKSATKKEIIAQVIIGGVLKERKGINVPALDLKFKGLTPKDRIDLEFGIKNKVDFIAQSFVRDEFDIIPLRSILNKQLPSCRIIAKIENRQGINNIKRILRVCDGIMIARGDMGVSIDLCQVPFVQKEIIKECNRAGKFVITATQMLESMVNNHRPTRAEVADVANAIIDGTDYVMLSAESAAGKYPVEAVMMMNRVIKCTEQSHYF